MVKCAKCGKVVAKKCPGVQCNKCSKWYHGSCASLTTDQLTALSITDSVDWKCRACTINNGGKSKRLSVILPDPEDEDSDAEGPITGDQEKFLLEIRKEIREMRQTVRDIIREELQNTLQYYSNKIDEYEGKVKDYEMRTKILENQCKDIANTCKNLSLKSEVLEQKLNKIEQAQSSNDIEICGIAEKDKEDVKQITSALCEILHQKTEDIVRVHRKKKLARPGTSQAERAKTDAPIMVTLREGCRDHWMEAIKTTRVCARDLGGESDARVYLRETLVPATAYLLWKTKNSLKEQSLCKYVWCKNGVIMVRKNDGDKIFYVRSPTDIERISKELQKK